MRLITLGLFIIALSACSSDSTSEPEEEVMTDDMKETSTEYSCEDSDHPNVGQMAILSTLSHQVAGQVLIKDNCTLEVTSFTYDGGGPAVYFYGGIDGDYESAGFPIGNEINGMVFDNDTLIIKLPDPVHLDKMNGVSVWCADFAVSFGDGLFQ